MTLFTLFSPKPWCSVSLFVVFKFPSKSFGGFESHEFTIERITPPTGLFTTDTSMDFLAERHAASNALDKRFPNSAVMLFGSKNETQSARTSK